MPQNSVKMRKNAKQRRSRQTVEAILEATAQLLETADVEQISTNHIAERAGVSIGTLYQYFPNKMAVFLAIAERDVEHRVRLVAETLKAAPDGSNGPPIRRLIRALVKTFSSSHRNAALIRVLMATRGRAPNRSLPVDAVAELLAQSAGDHPQTRPLNEVSAFVLTRSVLWTILMATMDAPHLLKQKAFEDELVRLTRSLLSAD